MAKSSEIPRLKVGNRVVYAFATGLRVGANGRVEHAATAVEPFSKSDRRKIRKWLDSIGRRDLAMASVPPREQAESEDPTTVDAD